MSNALCKDLINKLYLLRKRSHKTTIRSKRSSRSNRAVSAGEEKARMKFQLFQRHFVSPSLSLAIFGHKLNRLNHQFEIKISAKNAKVSCLESISRLSEPLATSNE